DIEGVTTSSHTTDATVLADNGAVFTVVVSNSAGTVTSSGAALTVNAAVAPTITAQPIAQTITAGATATFTVTATGTAPLSYQWKKNGTDISGATSSTYTTPAMSSGVAYSVVVSNSAGSATSSSASLTVNKSSATGYSYVPNPSGGNFARTECVKENSTGLVWEGKNPNGSSSRANTYFTNYDSTSSVQKPGTPTYVNPTQEDIDSATNVIGYRKFVNDISLCGYSDWRLPTKEELRGILESSGSPRIDTTWFPNTQVGLYWTSSPDLGDSKNAWSVSFGNGSDYNFVRDLQSYLRLVR
ncbi:MAG: DUF1566 domain-containing protein, partial [Rhodoferax sp.]|nr:DUF1566 domain-containing protein [Rhodoferax sp.]